MPTALHRFIVTALLLLPLVVHAGDAEDFLAANPTQQAKLLQDWAANPDPARIELVDALQQGQLTVNGETKTVRLNNRLRGLIDNVQASQQLLAADPKVRLAAAQTLQKSAQPAQLKFLDQQVAAETNEDVHTALSLALANLQLVDADPAIRLAAVRLLGSTGDPLARTRLEALLAPGVETDAAVHTAAETSLAQVKRKLMLGEILGQAFSGMSLGSILLLAALGLAITFGLLGVINMAHGEMLMLGAYSTYVVQLLMQRYVPAAIEFYPLIALPVAFFVTAAIGMALERTVIRHLYGRPLETLLATWGISLMLIQLVRLVFGAQNVEVSNPAWLSGGIQVLPNLVLPYNRIVIIAFALCVVVLTWLLLNKTRLGLNVRAVTQNRNMAACCGVPTGRVDMLAFGLGSGIAGLGGVALSQIGNVGPDLGQSYIIDSFLVVVLGGVGQLAGSVMAAFGLGIANKILEPQIGAVLGKILILALIILFIQKRPQGLFALKGRVID
ncbi:MULTISPECIES: urea ABC transporter permease subunit UrtB [Pseudomonas]|jgi:urea transport system permease protein|uniref:Amino acid/amide ABC transporter membrane protein 1, HAAT family n=1 Tax=Pseudomonas rhodesiae TaxID=76760 RepID=A0AAE8L144_9PSED|nr:MULTISPECIES: urea ABC transporter permease subunit UrtB [Pseudomonas]KAF6694945.1 urea ABC transporter permease subunit UrtB [Pseudomonas sp. EKM23D]MDN6863471.1 urea ABC transporter permease subunit UrtB [Pseudomonas rhodesiae]NMZ20489.1 urea ABC transporter permease subunit UrtB [Pseudomonas rhodesiae]POA61707.1 urea ABC transporter permease subunit UrtB [Pseudomonas sp. GW531-R1]QKJ71734.1 urea ABC transporter permease subunit UrtB [Pseudomonas rhodesiae]